jgi:glycosyltransferase involved in cell wall biosynthesis
MRVLVATRYFFRAKNGKTIKSGQGADIRIYELYSRLAVNNEVTVVTQNFTSDSGFSISNLSFSSEEFERMRVKRVPSACPFFFLTRLPSVSRFIGLLKFGKNSDVLIAEFHPFHSIGFEALAAKYLLGKPLLLDVHDIAFEEEGGLLGRFYLWYENFIARHADGIIATSPEMRDVFRKTGVTCPIMVVENGVDTQKRFRVEGAKRKLGFSEKVVVGFMGSLTPQHGAPYIVHAMPEIIASEPRAALLVVGQGRERERLQNIVNELGISDRVVFAGLVPYEKVNDYLSACDVLVAPFPKGRIFTTNLPLKLTEYLSMGITTVVTDGPVLKRVIEESGAGVVAEAENTHSLANSVLAALSHPELGPKGRSYAQQHLEWAVLAGKMEEFIRHFSK